MLVCAAAHRSASRDSEGSKIKVASRGSQRGGEPTPDLGIVTAQGQVTVFSVMSGGVHHREQRGVQFAEQRFLACEKRRKQKNKRAGSFSFLGSTSTGWSRMLVSENAAQVNFASHGTLESSDGEEGCEESVNS